MNALSRKWPALCLAVWVLLLGFAEPCMAHRVNVFAFVDNDAVQVEASFSKSQKVKNGTLIVSDSATGERLLEAVTDEQGLYRFRPSDDFLQTGHGLTILLLAGAGHQDSWQVEAEDLRALAGSASVSTPSPTVPVERAPEREAREVPALTPARDLPSIDPIELEALVGKVLDARLAPIKQELARQQNPDPGLRDIIGGLGWIFGLLGLITYIRYRR